MKPDALKQERWLTGFGASEGIAIGRVRLMAPSTAVVHRSIPTDQVTDELRRLQDAIVDTDHRLLAIGERLAAQGQREGHLILEAHRLMLKDTELVEGVRTLIRGEQLGAECAVRRTVDRIVAVFDRMRDPYLRERGRDVEAVGERLLGTLLGLPEPGAASPDAAGCIGVYASLSPIDAFHLGRLRLGGVVTERGGATSHAAIIVKALELPYALGVRGLASYVQTGDTIALDGGLGDVVVNPEPHTVLMFEQRARARLARRRALRTPSAHGTVTTDGVRIHLGANIEAPSEVAAALRAGAESVGLFRTEVLYLDRPDLPTEEEHYQDAVSVLSALGGRMATVRTLDLGGEKLPLGVTVPAGENPSLGVRGIRFSFLRQDIFRAQLRALYRASVMGPMRIMFPLIAGVAEMQRARQICAEVRDELRQQGIPFREHLPIGAMLETPSAVLTADHLARDCDFFSIGTNDLIQYAFAAERDNHEVSQIGSPLHPAVLRLLKLSVEAGAAGHRPVSICGDMVADPSLVWVLLGLGIRDFSMASRSIAAVRSVILGTSIAEAQALVAQLSELRSSDEAAALVGRTMRARFPIELDVQPRRRPARETPAAART